LALFFVRSRRANIALLSALILLTLVPNCRQGAIRSHFDAPVRLLSGMKLSRSECRSAARW
jgi:hypothetical protein